MRIDWQSWEEIRGAGLNATHLDLHTGAFINDEPSQDVAVSESRLAATPERYLSLWWGEEFPELHSGRLERALLYRIADEKLRRSALAAWWAYDTLHRVPLPSHEARKAERRRRRAALDALVSKAPELARCWHDRNELLARGGLWACLRAESIAIDNPPPWRAELEGFHAEVEAGWRTLLEDCLGRIDRWLAANAPKHHAALRPPATDPELDALQAALPAGSLALPAALRALYRWHGGTAHAPSRPPSASLVFGYALLSPEDARETHQMLTGLLRDGTFAERPPTWWNERWLPFLGNGGGDLWCVDLTPEQGGRIVWFLHDDARRKVLFYDVGAFIEAYAEALTAGLWRFDPDDGGLEPTDWDAWEEHCGRYGQIGEVVE